VWNSFAFIQRLEQLCIYPKFTALPVAQWIRAAFF
jgi:hypothetical protein